MKSFYTDTALRDEYYRDVNFAVDLIELQLKDASNANDTLYLASGAIDVDYNSPTAPEAGTNTYSAQGEFLAYSAINEDFDVKVGKFSINLSGLPSGYIDKFVNKEPELKRVCVYKAFLSTTDLQIVSSPILMYDGLIYNVGIQENATTCSITVECSSKFADFERLAGRKTNNWSNWLLQGVKYDTAMEKAGYVGNTEFLWGRNE